MERDVGVEQCSPRLSTAGHHVLLPQAGNACMLVIRGSRACLACRACWQARSAPGIGRRARYHTPRAWFGTRGRAC